MKQKIINNTIIFVLIIIFISVFSNIFGDANMLLGVGIATIALVLVERDLTIHPVLNTFKLLIINLMLGIFAYIYHSNIWLGLPLNFIALFFIGYVFIYNLRKSTVLPFGLTYLFMLFEPVEGIDAINRVYALIVGAFIIMGLQLLFNKNRFSKKGMSGIEKIYINILLKIEYIKEDRDTAEIDKEIQMNIKSVKKLIFDKRAKNFYLTENGEVLTDVIWTLERISILLDEFRSEFKNYNSNKILDKLYENLKSLFENKSNNLDLRGSVDTSYLTSDYIGEFNELINCLNKDIKKVLIWEEVELELSKLNIKIPEHFNQTFNHKKDFRLKSLRFSFGLRLAISVAIGAFLTQYFDLSEGRWMVYTIFSLIQPYYENCRTKAKQRVEGTLIGALIVLIAFNFIENTSGRFAVILIAGYLNPFLTNYRYMATSITVSAVASVALLGGTTDYIIARISFVLVGTVIALFANRFILPFKIEDGKKSIVEIYDFIIKQMITDIRSIESEHSIKGLFLLPSLIEDRMNILKFGVNCEKESEFIANRRVMINNIYKHYMVLKRNNKSREEIDEIIKDMEIALSN